MINSSPQSKVGAKLKRLISENYSSQEEFAFQFGADVRTISRYVNNGIDKISTIQDLAGFFNIAFMDFFKEDEEE